MKAQLEALKSKAKVFGAKVKDKASEATMTEHELRVKHGVEKPESAESKKAAAQEATMVEVKPRPSPAVMKVGRRIIK